MKMCKKVISIIGMMAFVLTMFCGWTNPITVSAAETATDYLPNGWTRIETGSLSSEQIEGIKDSISDENLNLRAPAPGLTSLQIIDLAVDDSNEIHVVTREIGTSRNRFVYWNGNMCNENINETQMLVGTDRIVYGYIRYFHTGIYYSTSLKGTTASVSARSTNAMNPWNTLSTSTTFVLP